MKDGTVLLEVCETLLDRNGEEEAQDSGEKEGLVWTVMLTVWCVTRNHEFDIRVSGPTIRECAEKLIEHYPLNPAYDPEN